MKDTQPQKPKHPIERFTSWIGSTSSLIFHTLLFILFFALSLLDILLWNRMLLVLTTVVSLEAIYLAIFIQMSVNRQGVSLEEVERDIDEIQEDIEEISEDEEEDEARQQKQMITLETLTKDVEQLLGNLEEFRRKE